MAANPFDWWDFPANPIQVELKDHPGVRTHLCTRVSPACGKGDCWAEAMMNRFHKNTLGALPYLKDSWDKVDIVLNSEILQSLRRKNEKLAALGEKQSVFLENLSDIFHEQYLKRSARVLDPVFYTVEGTTNLIYLALTKRTGNGAKYLTARYRQQFPHNLWLGFTAENQAYFDSRWRYYRPIAHRAAGIFVSYEPALGPLRLPPEFLAMGRRAWVIAGGKSGGKFEDRSNPAHPIFYYSYPGWFRDVRDQCEENNVNFFFKQYGTYGSVLSGADRDRPAAVWVRSDGIATRDEEAALADGGSWTALYRLGKKKAGRTIDGATYDEIPNWN